MKSTKRNSIRISINIVLIAFLLSVSASAAGGPNQILLSWTDDPATTQTVVWRSASSDEGYVQYVTQAQYNRTGFDGATQIKAVRKDVSLDNSCAWHFEATITGLSPATAYVYRVGNASGWSEAASFRAADTETESFSFVYFGDIQVMNNASEEFTLWGELAQAAYEKAPDMAFGLFGGDIVESGISLAQFDLFMENASPMFSKIPAMPTNGNHESNFIGGKPEMYLDVFALPENGPEGFCEEFYSFDYGDCHITVLNSWVFSGEQSMTDDDYEQIYDWIENDLSSSNATWKVVLTHHPSYALHSDSVAEKVRESWSPLFEKYGVSLVLMGHQHVYSRSYPMYNGSIDYENGIMYVMGNSGQKFYSSADERYSERTLYNVATYQLIRIDGNTLTLQTFNIDGNELDYCVISPRSSEASYSDVFAANWYYDAAEYAGKNNLIGAVDGKFAGNEPMTRLMLAEALYRLDGSPAVSVASPFTDEGAASVIWAFDVGIVNGIGDGSFAPSASITREQIAAMIYRYYEYLGNDTSQRGDTSAFTDAGSISDWAAEAMSWANAMKLINGMGDGTVAPKGTATRAQVAQILLNMKGIG